MRVSYSPDYFVQLPEGHAFPMGKFPGLYRILLQEGLLRPEDVVRPEQATWETLRLVHTEEYLAALATGDLDHKAERRLGLPWSQHLVYRSRLAVQGSINAAHMALEDGISANISGGTHHAFPDHGEGFCVLNDVAVAIRVLQQEGVIQRALVVDLDVHQGNGTAAIFADDPHVFTFSVHGEKNYPWHKPPSTRDVGLEDGTDDDEYMRVLEQHLPEVLSEAQPEIVFYLAGVDPVRGDRFGRLAMTRDGIHRRDRCVLECIRSWRLPLVLLMAGGYAATPELTADLHAVAHREASRIYTSGRRLGGIS